MRIDYVNHQIMDAMLAGYPFPRYAVMDSDSKEPLYIVATGGFVAYILEESEICFNLTRCRNDPGAFKQLLADGTLCSTDNALEPTLDFRVAATPTGKMYYDNLPIITNTEPELLARFKGAAWDTFVDVALLEAFDDAKYYQAKKNGPVAVVEGGCLVGYVMPVKCGSAEGHYTDSPSRGDE